MILFKSLQIKQIKMRRQRNHSDLEVIYCKDDDFSLERAFRDSFDSLPVSNEVHKYSFLVHKWGVDLNIHKSNEILEIILDHLLESEEKLTRLSNSLDIRHIDDPLFDPDLPSDDENRTVTDEHRFPVWLASTIATTDQRDSSKRKIPQVDPIENSSAAKKTKITESVPHELTPTRKSTSRSPTNDPATNNSYNTTDTDEKTGAAADETTAVNNDSDDSTTEFNRVMRDCYNHFMNNY